MQTKKISKKQVVEQIKESRVAFTSEHHFRIIVVTFTDKQQQYLYGIKDTSSSNTLPRNETDEMILFLAKDIILRRKRENDKLSSWEKDINIPE